MALEVQYLRYSLYLIIIILEIPKGNGFFFIIFVFCRRGSSLTQDSVASISFVCAVFVARGSRLTTHSVSLPEFFPFHSDPNLATWLRQAGKAREDSSRQLVQTMIAYADKSQVLTTATVNNCTLLLFYIRTFIGESFFSTGDCAMLLFIFPQLLCLVTFIIIFGQPSEHWSSTDQRSIQTLDLLPKRDANSNLKATLWWVLTLTLHLVIIQLAPCMCRLLRLKLASV